MRSRNTLRFQRRAGRAGLAVTLLALLPSATFAFHTKQHEAAARVAWAKTCAKDVLSEADAIRFLNDPDCPGNRCDVRDLTSANPDEYTRGREEDFSLAWAQRNWDHFGFNNYGPLRTPSIITADKFTEFKDNGQAIDHLLRFGRGQAAAAQVGVPPSHPDFKARHAEARILAKNALRAAFRAAHYSTDQMACGHRTGNLWCNWRDPIPSPFCKQFVDDPRNRATLGLVKQLGIKGFPSLGLGGAIPMGNGESVQVIPPAGSGTWVNIEPDLDDAGFPLPGEMGLGYATAERLIRHYSGGQTLYDPAPYNTTWTNGCHEDCLDGECLPPTEERRLIPPGSAGEQRVLGEMATSTVNQVCDALPMETTLAITTSTNFARPPLVHGEIGVVYGDFRDTKGDPIGAHQALRLPLPTTLGGSYAAEGEFSVWWNGTAFPLFYLSATQINFLVPANVRFPPEKVPYAAKDLHVTRNGRRIGEYRLEVTRGPELRFFTAQGVKDAQGRSRPVAWGLTIGPSGVYHPILRCSGEGCEPLPIPTDGQHAVVLFGSGSGNSDGHVVLEDIDLTVDSPSSSLGYGSPSYFGPQGTNPGLDQLNFVVPPSMCELARTRNPATGGDHELIVRLLLSTLSSQGMQVRFCPCDNRACR